MRTYTGVACLEILNFRATKMSKLQKLKVLQEWHNWQSPLSHFISSEANEATREVRILQNINVSF